MGIVRAGDGALWKGVGPMVPVAARVASAAVGCSRARAGVRVHAHTMGWIAAR